MHLVVKKSYDWQYNTTKLKNTKYRTVVNNIKRKMPSSYTPSGQDWAPVNVGKTSRPGAKGPKVAEKRYVCMYVCSTNFVSSFLFSTPYWCCTVRLSHLNQDTIIE